MFFVSGITGRVGGSAARRLLEQGHSVRALVRDPKRAAEWSAKGVELRQGDSADASAVAAALEGVEGAYLMVPPFFTPAPGFPETRAIIAGLREALRQAPPPKLVALSSIGSEQESGLGLITQTHLLEVALANLNFPVAFVRAGGFFENFIPALPAAAATGWLDTFLTPDHALPMIATEDIGNEVARLLTAVWSGRKIVELGSPASPDDVAQAMSKVLGRPVKARPIPREQWTATLEAQGFPPGSTRYFEEMEDSINSGWIHFGVPGTEPVAGTLTPAQVYSQAYLKQN
jgi:uncharacterized protein YbjT (DUF2867 family)